MRPEQRPLGEDRDRLVARDKDVRLAHQYLGDRLKQTPVPVMIGVGQIGPRDLTTKAQVIKAGAPGAKTTDDIAQAFTVGQLAKAKGEEVIVAGERARAPRRRKQLNTALKLSRIKNISDLRQDGGCQLHSENVD